MPKLRQSLATLTLNDRRILAVLCHARLRREEFPGGWVSADDLHEAVEGWDADGPSISRAMERTYKRLRHPSLLGPTVEKSRSGRDVPKCMRLTKVSRELYVWLQRIGFAHLERDLQQAHAPEMPYRATVTAEAALALDEGLLRKYVNRSEYASAFKIADRELRRRSAPFERAPIILWYADGLMKRGNEGDLEAAEKLLREGSPSGGDRCDHLNRMRLQVAAVQCNFFLHVWDEAHTLERADYLRRLQTKLKTISLTTPELSHADLGRIVYLQGLFRFWEAQTDRSPVGRDAHFYDAEQLLKRAFRIFQTSLKSYHLADVLLRLGDLCQARHRLLSGDHRADLNEAIDWYRLAIEFGKGLGWHPEHGRAFHEALACVLLLLPETASTKKDEELVLRLREHADETLAAYAAWENRDPKWHATLREQAEEFKRRIALCPSKAERRPLPKEGARRRHSPRSTEAISARRRR